MDDLREYFYFIAICMTLIVKCELIDNLAFGAFLGHLPNTRSVTPTQHSGSRDNGELYSKQDEHLKARNGTLRSIRTGD